MNLFTYQGCLDRTLRNTLFFHWALQFISWTFVVTNAWFMNDEIRAFNLFQGAGLRLSVILVGIYATWKYNKKILDWILVILFALLIIRSFTSVDSTISGMNRNLSILSVVLISSLYYRNWVGLYMVVITFFVNVFRFFGVQNDWFDILIVENKAYYEIFFFIWLMVYVVTIIIFFKQYFLHFFDFRIRTEHKAEVTVAQFKEKNKNKSKVFEKIRLLSIQKLAEINALSADIRCRFESFEYKQKNYLRNEIVQLSAAIDAILRDIDRLSMQSTLNVTESFSLREDKWENEKPWGDLVTLDRNAFIVLLFYFIAYAFFHPNPTDFFSVALNIPIFIGLVAFYLSPKSKQLPVAYITYFLVGVILTYYHSKFTTQTGVAPYLTLTELMYMVFLLFRFSNKLFLLVPIWFLVLTISTPLLMHFGYFNHLEFSTINGLKMSVVFLVIGISFTGLVHYFKLQLEYQMKKTEKSITTLRKNQKELQRLQKDINQRLVAIRDLADRNSHEVRRPVARIRSLYQLMDECSYTIDEMEANTGLKIEQVSLASLDELDSQLGYLHSLLKEPS